MVQQVAFLESIPEQFAIQAKHDQWSAMVMLRYKAVAANLPIVACLATYAAYHAWAANQIPVPVWDGAVYMILARDLLTGQPLYEFFRPLVLPGIIAITWLFTGVNYEIPKFIPLLFTVGSAWILYSLVKPRKGNAFALLTTVCFLFAAPIMLWTDHLLPESLSLFFVLLSVWFLSKGTLRGWLLGGLSSSVAILARYPTAVIVFGIFFVFLYQYRKLLLADFLALGVVLPIAPIYLYSPPLLLDVVERNFGVWSQIASSEIAFAAPSPHLPIQYYAVAMPQIFTFLVPFLILSLISLSTYKDSLTKIFAVWFIVAFVSFSLVPNKETRFMFEWVPAIAILSVDGLQKAWNPISKQIAEAAHWKSPRNSAKVLLGCILVVLIAASVFFAINSQVSMYRRDYSNLYAGQVTDAGMIKVAQYVKNATSDSDVIISDFQAPILALYADRPVYSVQVVSMDKLSVLLEIGFGSDFQRPTLVVFFTKQSGYDSSVLQQQDFLQLKASFLVSPTLGTVYIFTFVG
jgi:4-amino-4-deoxy-L-arabinose transferase-like glycosyltransferase